MIPQLEDALTEEGRADSSMRAAGRLSGVEFGAAALGEMGPLRRLEGRSTASATLFDCLQHPFPNSDVDRSAASGLAHPRPLGLPVIGRLGAHIRAPDQFSGNLRGPERFHGTCCRTPNWVVQGEPQSVAKTIRRVGRTADQRCARVSTRPALSVLGVDQGVVLRVGDVTVHGLAALT